MRKRRMSKVSFNSKLIVDVVGASLLVQQAPKLINMIFPVPESVQAVVGVGAGYLVGSMLKRPDLANASIALGVIGIVSPLVEDLIGGTSSNYKGVPMSPPQIKVPLGISVPKNATIDDYFSLNDYIANPSDRQNYLEYRDQYSY